MRRLSLRLACSCVLALIVLGIARSDEPRQKECRTDLTIYIDLSGTVTASRRGQPAPLRTLAEMLSRLLAQDERFASGGDRVRIIALGAEAKPLLDIEGLDSQSRDSLRETLANFTTSDWKKSAAVKNITDLDEFAKRTDFQSLFDDVADRVIGSSSGRRQILIIASDFADDPVNDCDAGKRTAHLRLALSSFVAREGIQEAFAPEADHQPYAQMILLATRPSTRCSGLDATLSGDLLDGLTPLRPHLIKDFDEKGAVQLATDIRERSAAAIRTGHVGANGSRLTFRIFNPTCSDVTIDRVILSRTNSGPTSTGYSIPLRNPVTVTTEKRESDLVEVEHPQVKTWRNATLTLQPLANGVKSVPVEFWNGDSISIDHASPTLLPQIGSEGKLVMVVDLTVNAEDNQKYRFTLPDVPKRSDGHKNDNSRDVDVAASGDEPAHRHVALVYAVSNRELKKLRQRT
ncbi:MAG: hypothetical protein JWO97_4843, partial [Acidobacteria bacterium]|nr:hypothetical protein [Acidobacteriota bacterium]